MKTSITVNQQKLNKKPIVIDGITYPSVKAVCQVFGISRSTYYDRIKKGIPVNQKPHASSQQKSVTLDGIDFPSITDCHKYVSKARKIDIRTLTKFLKQGMTESSQIEAYLKKSDANRVTKTTKSASIREDEIETQYNNFGYLSLRQVAEQTGFNAEVLAKIIKHPDARYKKFAQSTTKINTAVGLRIFVKRTALNELKKEFQLIGQDNVIAIPNTYFRYFIDLETEKLYSTKRNRFREIKGDYVTLIVNDKKVKFERNSAFFKSLIKHPEVTADNLVNKEKVATSYPELIGKLTLYRRWDGQGNWHKGYSREEIKQGLRGK